MEDAPIWTPSPSRAAASGASRFIAHLASADVVLSDTRELHRYSCDQPAGFWRAVWTFADLQGDPGPVDVIGDDFESTAFFPAGTVDVAATMLAGPGDDLAVVECDDTGTRLRLTRAELRERVASTASILRSAGVGPGDVVAAYSTTSAATLTVMLATASCGAVFTSSSAEFGAEAVIDRFAQVSPVALLVVDGYRYAGRRHMVGDRARAILAALPSVELVLTVDDVDLGPDAPRTVRIDGSRPAEPLVTSLVGFNDPGSILYSSGTTGKPKCIVHRAGGVLLKHLSEQLLHCDIRPGDRVFYYTTTSWMMWNWLVSALAARAAVVLYDGAPLAPDPRVLLDMAAREGVTYFGTSPSYLEELRRRGIDPSGDRTITSLRTVAVTGAPLAPRTARFAAGWGDDVHVLSKSGGTDLCGGLLSGDPTRPAFAGEIQMPALGCRIAVLDDAGHDVPAGDDGELVSRTPFPSMPLRFVGDDDGRRLHDQYYARFPGCWHQSDFVSETVHGGYVVHGRSDTTLNVNGVRIGTAEIYAQLERLPWIRAAAAVARFDDEGARMVLLLEIGDGLGLDDERRDAVRQTLRERCSPRHVPSVIEEVPELPRTMNGKLSEMAVTDALNGRRERLGGVVNAGSLVAVREIAARLERTDRTAGPSRDHR